MEFSDLSFQFLFLNGVFKEKTIGNPATPLHEAARRGDLKMCEILLNYKSDPCLMDAKNHAAIHLAAFGVGFKIVQLSCTVNRALQYPDSAVQMMILNPFWGSYCCRFLAKR